MAISMPEIQKKHWHKIDTDSGRLERYLESKGIDSIGDVKWRDQLWINNGADRRSPDLDMFPLDRGYRSYCVNKLSQEGLAMVHSYEQRKMLRFLTRQEMMDVSKENIEEMDGPNKIERDNLIKFGEDSRPAYNKKFNGFHIPPYFHLDLEFDGMNYHHEWDKKAQSILFSRPVGSKGGLSGREDL